MGGLEGLDGVHGVVAFGWKAVVIGVLSAGTCSACKRGVYVCFPRHYSLKLSFA